MTQQPSVGQIVHYTARGLYPADQPIAAIITEVYGEGFETMVRLDIRWPTTEELSDSGNIYKYAETSAPGHWNWRPRV